LSHSASPSCFMAFFRSDLPLLLSRPTFDFSTMVSHLAGMTDMCHHIQLIGWNGVLLTLCLGWSWTVILPDLYLPSSWDHRCEPAVSMVFYCCDFLFTKLFFCGIYFVVNSL
jgi:hypothetical protein